MRLRHPAQVKFPPTHSRSLFWTTLSRDVSSCFASRIPKAGADGVSAQDMLRKELIETHVFRLRHDEKKESAAPPSRNRVARGNGRNTAPTHASLDRPLNRKSLAPRLACRQRQQSVADHLAHFQRTVKSAT